MEVFKVENDNTTILKKINSLQNEIESGEFHEKTKSTKEWGGTDVIIGSKMTPMTRKWLDDQNLVINSQKTAPRKRVVITLYSRELSGF